MLSLNEATPVVESIIFHIHLSGLKKVEAGEHCQHFDPQWTEPHHLQLMFSLHPGRKFWPAWGPLKEICLVITWQQYLSQHISQENNRVFLG